VRKDSAPWRWFSSTGHPKSFPCVSRRNPGGGGGDSGVIVTTRSVTQRVHEFYFRPGLRVNGVLSVQESVDVVLSSTDENRFDDDIVGRVLYFKAKLCSEKTHRYSKKKTQDAHCTCHCLLFSVC